jgi:hypothetical protein
MSVAAGPITVVEIYRLAYEQARAAVAGATFHEMCVRISPN